MSCRLIRSDSWGHGTVGHSSVGGMPGHGRVGHSAVGGMVGRSGAREMKFVLSFAK